MLVSIADIAKRLSRRGDIAQVRERLMNWTRSGALSAINRRLLGKGIPRLFEHGAIVHASVFNQLTDMKFDVVGWEHAIMAREIAREAARRWAQGERREQWLEITWTAGNPFSVRGLPKVRIGPALDPRAAGVIHVNLSQMFQRIAWSDADELADASMEIPKFTRRRTTVSAPSTKAGKHRNTTKAGGRS